MSEVDPPDQSVGAGEPGRLGSEAASPLRRETSAVLIAGTALHTLIRVWIALPRTGPVVVADEIGYLLNARVISGGPGGDLGTTTFYRGGYSLLIAPLFALNLDPVHLYLAILTFNAAVGASTFPLMYVLLGRLFSLSGRARLAASFAAACTPSLIVSGGFATSDAVLPTLVVALVALLVNVCSGPAMTRKALYTVVLFSAVAALMWTAHARGQLVVLVLLVSVVGRRFFGVGRKVRQQLALTIILSGALVIAGDQLNEYLALTIYNRSGSDLPVISRTFDADVLTTLGAGVGQAWSLLVTTGGLSLVGLIVLWRRGRQLLGSHSLGVAVTLGIAGVVGASALGFDGLQAESFSIYSRYADMFAPLLVGIACAGVAARVVSGRMWLGTGLAMPVLALGPALLDPARSDLGDSRPFSVPIVTVLSGVAPSADALFVDTSLVLPTIVAVLFVAVVGVATRSASGPWRSLLFTPLAGSAMLVGGMASVVVGYSLDDDFYPNAASIGSLSQVSDASVVVWDKAPASNPTLRFVFEYSTGRELVQFDSTRRDPPEGDVLITSTGYEPPAGWVLIGPVPETDTMVVYEWTG